MYVNDIINDFYKKITGKVIILIDMWLIVGLNFCF